MIISSPTDYREAARRRLPPFLFHYLDGGSGAETTLKANTDDLHTVALKQRVLKGSETLDLSAEWFGVRHDLPICLAPVGLAGMYARRGEVQAAKAAAARYIYEPVVPREDMARTVISGVLHTFFENSIEKAVATLIDQNDAPPGDDQLDRLAAMIEKARKEGR